MTTQDREAKRQAAIMVRDLPSTSEADKEMINIYLSWLDDPDLDLRQMMMDAFKDMVPEKRKAAMEAAERHYAIKFQLDSGKDADVIDADTGEVLQPVTADQAQVVASVLGPDVTEDDLDDDLKDDVAEDGPAGMADRSATKDDQDGEGIVREDEPPLADQSTEAEEDGVADDQITDDGTVDLAVPDNEDEDETAVASDEIEGMLDDLFK